MKRAHDVIDRLCQLKQREQKEQNQTNPKTKTKYLMSKYSQVTCLTRHIVGRVARPMSGISLPTAYRLLPW